jgi:uncharacterized protein YjgD (DUF1641 family)
MAQPITKILPRPVSGEAQWLEMKELIFRDPETAGDILRFVRGLRSAGVLEFLTALLEQKDSVLHLLIGELDKPGVKKAVNNLEQLADFLGSVPPDTLHRTLQAAGRGFDKMGQAQQASGNDSLSIFQLLGSLKNPDIARALRTILAFLEGFGQAAGPAPHGG